MVTKTSAFLSNGASGFVYAQPYELSFRYTVIGRQNLSASRIALNLAVTSSTSSLYTAAARLVCSAKLLSKQGRAAGLAA
jgi:hypothetical protein